MAAEDTEESETGPAGTLEGHGTVWCRAGTEVPDLGSYRPEPSGPCRGKMVIRARQAIRPVNETAPGDKIA